MDISNNAQELLERFWVMANESQSKLPDSLANNGEFDELIELGLINPDGAGYQLTSVGLTEAALAIRRHRLAERLLADILVTESDLIDQQACGLEHALFDGLDESICTLLGHPQFCPHGKPIPQGRCCQQMRASVDSLIAPLVELKPGQRGSIAYLHTADPQRLNKLMAMGIIPGAPIRVNEVYPSFVFEAGYSQFAVDNEIASDIYIRKAI